MKRLLVAALVLFATASLASAPADRPLHMAANRAFEPGEHLAVVSLYANESDETPLAVETHRVTVDAHGGFSATFDNLAAFGDGKQQRWIGVRLLPGTEGPRRKVAASSRPIRVLVVPLPAITGDGYVESTVDGFRFPGGEVFSGFGTPASVGTSNTAGIASTISRSDHIHAHGTQSGGTLHSDATVSVSGFMSATDKTKVDATVAYVRTVVVSPTVANPTASGTTLINALNAITGPSSTDPYLLKIEPGVYNIGSGQLIMKSYVDIEGSGENATFITAARVSSTGPVLGAPNTELRNLTLTNSTPGTVHTYDANGTGNYRLRDVTINATTTNNATARGPFADGGSALFLVNVTAIATAGTGASSPVAVTATNASTVNIFHSTITVKGVAGSTGTNIGVSAACSTCAITMDSSTVIATGEGSTNTAVSASSGPMTITNSTIRAETATTRKAILAGTSPSAVVNVAHSTLIATGGTAVEESGSATLRVASSLVDGAVTGTPTCLGTYNATFVALNATCQ